MATRIGVDIGGTFTDLIFYDDETGDVHVAKTATTPHALEEGVERAVRTALAPGLVQGAEFFMHGTTIGLNALLQRTGARVGLLCTSGFRDVLEIARGDRAVMYDIFWKQPSPLVPRRHRLPVRERVRADGEVLVPLAEEDVREALVTFDEAEIEAIAVCFMNSYVNPEHELVAERVLLEAGFEGDLSLSHRLSREYREFERTSTSVVDAYIRGATSRYLGGLRAGLRDAGFGGEVLITRSGGGAMTASELEERPFEAIQSGPVAGAEGAAELCRSRGWQLAITADVGGTSFDTALIVDGRPEVHHEGSIEGWPLQTSWVDVNSIGAGGGSIAYADGGLLRVGPRSAGAVPGPACYGGGGSEPTVTDAALLLGMFGDGVLGEDLRLDADRAELAVRPVAEELGLDVREAAQGILTVVSAAMAEAIREITIGQGEDPRAAKLITFGGAGSLFGTLLATELDVPEVIVPPYAGNFSAWGLLGQDVTRDAARTLIRRVEPAVLDDLNQHLDDMFIELAGRAGRNGGSGAVERIVALDLRYAGQEHTLTIRTETDGRLAAGDLEAIARDFETDYERRFGTTLEEPLELVTLRATTRTGLPRKARERLRSEASGVERPQAVRAYSFSEGGWLDFAVVERTDLDEATRLRGPAIVFEPTATTYLDSGFTLTFDPSGSLCLAASGGAGT